MNCSIETTLCKGSKKLIKLPLSSKLLACCGMGLELGCPSYVNLFRSI